MNDWQPIETAPKDGTGMDVLCELIGREDEFKHVRFTDVSWNTGNLGGVGWFRVLDDGDWEYLEAGDIPWRLTHWMPLPEPPE